MKSYSVKMLGVGLFFLPVFLLQPILSAQDSPQIDSTLNINGSRLSLINSVPADVNTGKKGQAEIDFMQDYVSSHLLISNKENPCKFKLSSFDIDSKGTHLKGVYSCDTNIDSIDHLKIENGLYREILPQSNHKMEISSSSDVRSITFTPEKIVFPVDFVGTGPTSINVPDSSGSTTNGTSNSKNSDGFLGSKPFYLSVIGATLALILGIYFYRKQKKLNLPS